MKKKLISLFLVLALVVGICPAAFAGEIISSIDINGDLYAAYISNVGAESNKLKNNALDKGEKAVEICDFSAIKIEESGELKLSGNLEGIPFEVCARPYDSPANKNVQVFEAMDTLDNYIVLYFDIEQNIQDSALYFNDVSLDSYTNVIKLYLRPNDSSDFVVMELFTTTNYAYEYLEKPISKDINAPGRANQLWYTKVFYAPLEEESNANSPTPFYVKEWASTIEYSQKFSHLGYDWKQRFSITLYVSYPTSFSNTEIYSTGYRVADSRTECISKPNESTNFANIDLTNARADIVTGPGTATHGYTITGRTQKAAAAKVKINFNTTVKINSLLSISLSYTDAHWSSLNTTSETFEGKDYVREFGFDLGSDKLIKVDDYLNVDWAIKNYGGTNTNVPFKVRFSYMVINELNVSDWSGQTQTKDVTVYSNTTA